MTGEVSIVPMERVEQAIYLIRGQKGMLDRDLAVLYDVETRVLNQAVARNINRFPSGFMFELTREEIMTPPEPKKNPSDSMCEKSRLFIRS